MRKQSSTKPPVRAKLEDDSCRPEVIVDFAWKLLRARAVGLKWGPLNAKSKDVAVEYVVIACERLEME